MVKVMKSSDVQVLCASMLDLLCVLGARETKEAGVRTCRIEKQGMGTIFFFLFMTLSFSASNTFKLLFSVVTYVSERIRSSGVLLGHSLKIRFAIRQITRYRWCSQFEDIWFCFFSV